jgi:hypothetical protein
MKEAAMAKIKKRRLRWKASTSPQVVGYKLYWAVNDTPDYNSDCIKLGNVTEITLPDDVKDLADANGPVEVGIAAIDEVGNESDMVTLKMPFQFAVPAAPSELRLEALRNSSENVVETPRRARSMTAEQVERMRGHAPEFIETPQESFGFANSSLCRDSDAVKRLEERASKMQQSVRPMTDRE